MAKQKGNYVDGFVFVVPKKNAALYRKMAELGKKLWLKHGALDYKECIGDDLNPKSMGEWKQLSFRKMTKAKAGEDVWFSYIVFKSKKHRNEVNARVMKDPTMNDPQWQNMPPPFDMKRMAYGGFKVMVSS